MRGPGGPEPVDAAVLVLLSGCRVLVVRKSCNMDSPWACDTALPGGRLRDGEDPVEAALREAWEEARVHPASVKVVGVMEVHRTLTKGIRVAPVVAVPAGPLDPYPSSGEVDAVAWIHLDWLGRDPEPVVHPVRGVVTGYKLPGGLVLWGLTMRILRSLIKALGRHAQ
jgi:8-oxo-dGTP pyrophosphatase MutT (NUDIX family)